MAVDVDGEHALGKDLADEWLAVGDGDVAGRVLENGRATTVVCTALVSVEFDDAFDRSGVRIDDRDVSGLGNTPVRDEQPPAVLEKMVRVITVGKPVGRRGIQFVGLLKDQRNAAHVEPRRLADVLKRFLEKDVGALGGSAGACLKAALAENDAAVRPEILDSAVESVDGLLGDGLRPELAFDDPVALLSKLLKADVHVDLVVAPCARHGLVDVGRAAEVSEDRRGRLLIVLPAPVFRAHRESTRGRITDTEECRVATCIDEE